MSDLIRAAKLWARTSARTGGTYYVGRMGGVRVLILENRERQGEDEPSHFLFLGDAEVGQEQPQARPERRPQAPASGDAPGKGPARPAERGDGWRGSRYRRPASGAQRAPAADGGALPDDDLADLYR
jgi:hypothetical protein